MRIDAPIFSGSIEQGDYAYSNLSGSFTGSFIGSSATFEVVSIANQLGVGSNINDASVIVTGSIEVTGSVNVSNNGAFTVDGVNVLDSAIAFSIALG